ncbi:MAG TPA: SDR family oxidoreductase [Patescibacteria group bacterium]|jgi:NAD(P)-dependent dehydrogenase (short-subunit alcohol dehydrogenase family)|nr:SDR family oxidoreductase [Patescibacteria group bacterium]
MPDTLHDPRKRYSQGAIPEQTQKEPGLDSKLKPLAEHGDKTYQGSGKLEGRRALITGGDSGIGRAVAIAFAREGASVAISYLPSEESDANSLTELLAKEDKQITCIPGDLTEESFARALPHLAHDKLGGLDIVVNNAGKQIYNDDIQTLPTRQLIATFTVNIFAMFWIVQEALEYLRPGASIINTTSIQATQPSPGLLDYAATKGAITNFTRGLSQQLTPKGIRVNAVAPGPIWTPLQPSYGQSQDKLVEFGQSTPMGRPGQPAELASAYVYLASDDSSYVSGEIIGITGGQLR